MRSLIFLGLWAPRLCPSPPPAPQKVSVPESARRKPRTLERRCVCGPLNAHRLSHSMQTHRSDQSQVLAPVLWHSAVSSRSPGSPRPQAIHRDVRPALIYEYQPPDVEARSQPSPQGPRSLVAFGSYGRLFLSGHSLGSRAMERLIVASETSTPVSSKKASLCSLRVRSGLDFSCSGSHSLKASPFSAGLPGIFIVSTPPVWRLLLSQRLMVERETPKRSWTSFLGMPRSIAASVFNLRSLE